MGDEMKRLILTCLIITTTILFSTSASGGGSITNVLGLDWPWELVHWKTNLTGPVSVRIGHELRPAQSDGSNVWFIATVSGKEPTSFQFENTATPSPLSLRDGVVANGIYEYRLDGGFRVAGGREWYGESRWDNDPGKVETVVLANGPVFIVVKQTHATGYERTLRFVAGDPWIDVTEKYDTAKPNMYWIEFKEGLRPDTVFWVPWFGHGGFVPIGKMLTHPLRPQEKQGARPFVTLLPRWNQSPGGGMDFFVTRSESNAPAAGVIATCPAKWRDPYNQAIRCYAENGDSARVEFPVHRGERAYALVIGPRSRFDSTGKLDNLVRRHTDWTLDDQIHKYILEWPRDSSKAGPHILITREELAKLREDYRAGRDTPAMKLVRHAESNDKLTGVEKQLIALITGKPTSAPSPPGATHWIGRRYQDDFLNPTTHTRAIKNGWPVADLLSDGRPIGGPWQAAVGYIFSDLNHWPGWEFGWSPGNPNFHTDKYMVALFAGAAMPDHPHAKQWLDFGKTNFDQDVAKVFFEPDGVGYECPGYSGYSLGLQLEVARVLLNAGYGNLVAANPLWKKNAIWHRHLLTPVDPRLGFRREAPIGDTHRWASGGVKHFGVLAKYFTAHDPAFARELMGIHALLRQQGQPGSLFDEIVNVPHEVEPLPLSEMDWGSHAFEGFGAVMRSRFGTPRETFVSFKAGHAHGHYHNDDLSYHFHGDGAPLSLDYSCSYSPRGDHAALHNSMTFGRQAPLTHAGDTNSVPAQEQIRRRARVLAFKTSPAADAVIAEREDDRLQLAPIYPEQARYGYGYPVREAAGLIKHRRTLVLVKHGASSPLADYLVIRDDTISLEPQQLNVHLLTRDVKREGSLIRGRGQWDTDALVYLARATETEFTVGRWYYGDKKANDAEIRATDGRSLIPPEGHAGTWMTGEYQQWLRIETQPGTPILWVLYPKKRNAPEPRFETLPDGNTVRVTLGLEVDEIQLTGQQAVVRQNGRETMLIDDGVVQPLQSGK
jgi:hypothetical protein